MNISRRNVAVAARNLYRWIGSTFYAAVMFIGANTAASTAITGATETETAFNRSASIPANVLEAGCVVRVRACGVYTATTGSETHSLILKIGATTIGTLTLIDPANDDIFYFEAVIVVRTAGASGTCVATGTVLAAAANQVGTAKPFLLASTAIDTTVANTLAVYIDRQGSATDGDSARLDIVMAEILSPSVAVTGA